MLASFKSPRIKQSTLSSSLVPSSALTPTHPNAITPNKTGSFSAYRWLDPIVKSKTFTTSDVVALEALAAKAEGLAANGEKAYKAAETIAKSQEKLHKAYNGYRLVESKSEFAIQESNAKIAAHLGSQRLGYHALAQGVQQVHMVAEQQIAASIQMFG